MLRSRLIAAILVVVLAVSASADDGFVTLSYPLAVSVEGSSIPTALHMKFDIKRYDVPFDTFAARDLDAREARFVEWVKVVRTRNYAKAESLFEAPKPVKPAVAGSDERSRVVATNRTPTNVVDMYHGAFGGLHDVVVVAQILAGEKSLFVWEARGGKSKIRRAFSVDDRLEVSEVTMSNPVELLIVNNVMDRGARDEAADRGVPGFKAPFEYAFPLEGAWTPGAHPVVLQFSGEAVDVPFYGDGQAAGAVARLYREAYTALRERDVEQFVSHMTARSREKWMRWYRTLSPEDFQQYLRTATAPREIKFILNASPLRIVFHGEPGNWTTGSLRYDYVVDSPGSGPLLFANVAFSGFFDDVLNSPTLFDQNVFRQKARVAAVSR